MAAKRQEVPADYHARCELARLIMESALEKCERLGVNVRLEVGVACSRPYDVVGRKLR